jgi:hypothetical protein
MPDFDSFERLFKSVMAADLSSEVGALQISTLPEANKVQVVKGRSTSDLILFLERARTSLLKYFPNGADFTSSDNNRQGKDLFEVNSRTHIELKSGGSMTDANPGLSTVAWALDDHDGRVISIMKGGMTERRILLQKSAPSSQIEASKAKTMDDLAEFFGKQLSNGPAPARLAHFFRSVAVGLTKGEEIRKSFQSERSLNTPLLLEADWATGLSLYEKAFLPAETIEIIKIERTPDRAQLIARGSESGRLARLYPNYKNSWKAPNGMKYDASNWVQNACFHVWIG